MESFEQLLMRKTGRKPTECKCQYCKAQCNTPGLCTPNQILNLINAGYKHMIAFTLWSVPVVRSKPLIIPMYQLKTVSKEEAEGINLLSSHERCSMYVHGLCYLHDKTYNGKRLKPLECILSHHSIKKDNYNFTKSLSFFIAKEWLNFDDNGDVIIKILEELEGNYKKLIKF